MLFATKLLVGQCESEDGSMMHVKVVNIDSHPMFMTESNCSSRLVIDDFIRYDNMLIVTRVKDNIDGINETAQQNVRSFDFNDSDNVDPLTLKFEVKPWIQRGKYPLRDGREYWFTGSHLVIDDRSSTRCHRMERRHAIIFAYELPASKRDIRIAIDLLTAVKPGPALPKVLAELIVSYITG